MSFRVPSTGHRVSRIQRDVRVATYNIHRALGCDNRLEVGRIVEVIETLDADVIALQELETPEVQTSAELLDRLTEVGYEAVLGPTILSAQHSYGNALLTRLPVLSCTRVDISVDHREPRGLIDVQLGVVSGASPSAPAGGAEAAPRLRCVTTHLGLDPAERGAQIARIIEQLDDPRMDSDRGMAPIILLGDFNEWRPTARLRPIDARLRRVPPRATWPARWPLLSLDRIWYGGDIALLGSQVVRSGHARVASDHLPLRAGFRLNPDPDPQHHP
jgi:endonuclease/exonuclease/phosphatase family metal-dependent hydrolase